MHFTASFSALMTLALSVVALPSPSVGTGMVSKREVSYSDPDLVVDQGDRWKLNFGSRDGHYEACPGHFICYIEKVGDRHDDESWGDPDDMVDEGDRWRFNYPTASGNHCGDHYICYYPK